MHFEVNKGFHVVLSCKSFNLAVFVPLDSLRKIRGHTHVKCSVAPARHDVDIEWSFQRKSPEFFLAESGFPPSRE